MDIKIHDKNQITVNDFIHGQEVTLNLMVKPLPEDTRKTLLEKGENVYMLARSKMDRRFKRVRASRPNTSPAFMLTLIEWFLSAKGLRAPQYIYLCRDVAYRTPEGGFYRLSVYFYDTCLYIDISNVRTATIKYCYASVDDAIDSYIDFYLGEKDYMHFLQLEQISLDREANTVYLPLGHDLHDMLKISIINTDELIQRVTVQNQKEEEES